MRYQLEQGTKPSKALERPVGRHYRDTHTVATLHPDGDGLYMFATNGYIACRVPVHKIGEGKPVAAGHPIGYDALVHIERLGGWRFEDDGRIRPGNGKDAKVSYDPVNEDLAGRVAAATIGKGWDAVVEAVAKHYDKNKQTTKALPVEFGLNARFLADLAAAIGATKRGVRLTVHGELAPIDVRPLISDPDTGPQGLLMPVRLNV